MPRAKRDTSGRRGLISRDKANKIAVNLPCVEEEEEAPRVAFNWPSLRWSHIHTQWPARKRKESLARAFKEIV